MNTISPLFDPGLQDHDVEHEIAGAVPSSSRLRLDPQDYAGGIAFWGALPAVFDTSGFTEEEGVHVHARREVGGPKEIDQTFQEVEIPLPNGQGCFVINGVDGVAYNIATILHRELTALYCPNCGEVHCDVGFNAVNYHSEHTCEKCGSIWTSPPSISNPLMLLKSMVGDNQQHRPIIDPVERRFVSSQKNWKGGIQLWGSNPALIWTSPKFEEGGIHVHACPQRLRIGADETFGTVAIDGLDLDPEEIRHLMAQTALDYLRPSIESLNCPHCKTAHFDKFGTAVVPHTTHDCSACGQQFRTATAVVSNPALAKVRTLYQTHDELFPSSDPSSCKQCLSRL